MLELLAKQNVRDFPELVDVHITLAQCTTELADIGRGIQHILQALVLLETNVDTNAAFDMLSKVASVHDGSDGISFVYERNPAVLQQVVSTPMAHIRGPIRRVMNVLVYIASRSLAVLRNVRLTQTEYPTVPSESLFGSALNGSIEAMVPSRVSSREGPTFRDLFTGYERMAGNRISIVNSGRAGYAVCAAQDLPKGACILQEEPLVCVLPDPDLLYCALCCTRLKRGQTVACPQCATEGYCSEDCRATCFDGYHRALCGSNYVQTFDDLIQMGNDDGFAASFALDKTYRNGQISGREEPARYDGIASAVQRN